MKKKLIISMLVLTLSGSTIGAHAVNIEESKQQLNRAAEEKEALQEKLNQKSSEVDNVSKEIEQIDKQMMTATEELEQAKALLQKTEEEVLAVEKELQTAEEKLSKKQEQLNARINAMYKNSSAGYLEVVLGANDVVDLLNRVSMIKDIVNYDSEIISQIKTQKEIIVKKGDELKVKKEEAKVATQNAEAKRAELEEVSNSKVAYMETLKNDETAFMGQIERLESESQAIIKSIQEEEARLLAEAQRAEQARQAELMRQAEIARQAEASARAQTASVAQRSSSSRSVTSTAPASAPAPQTASVEAAALQSSSSSGYIRPLSGGRISSVYGTNRGSYNHGGMDVAVPQGTPIVAVADGVVARSHYSSSYGEVVYINHGGGIVTISAHNSRRTVSDGQAVKKGQVIAYSGNTGQSTGPHLHFEVVKNGSKTDPRNYINF